jgi:alpha-galactosidase
MNRHGKRFFSRLVSLILAFGCAALVIAWNTWAKSGSAKPESRVAQTPPMGWNSWDACGESVSEKEFRANAQVVAKKLKSHGWQYVVVDMGWYVTNHSAGANSAQAEFSLDAFGRFTPATNSFPSAANGAGFKPLADYVHSLGLKFGIHIIRGIPREAVAKNLAIAGTSFHAADAADTSDTCPWNTYMYGLDPAKPAAQAYYDSLARLYASWGVDFVKVDCIASHPYKPEEIRMISEALRKSGRPMVLSLSPGPAPLDHAQELSRYSNMWRISDDIWDVWRSDTQFPRGPGNQFDRAAKWAPYSGPGHWPDADMLPLGSLRPTPGWGKPRETRLTRDEQRTLLTLWCIFRSPLIMGGNLAALGDDPWTASLLTNDEVLAVDQHSTENHAALSSATTSIWIARPSPNPSHGYYVAVFNLKDSPQTIRVSWKVLGLDAPRYALRDLWEHKDLPEADQLSVNLPAHASVLYLASVR